MHRFLRFGRRAAALLAASSALILLMGPCPVAGQTDTATAPTPRDTSYWKLNGIGALNITQAGFTNWAQGGENSFSFNTIGNLSAIYSRGRLRWQNLIDLSYGMIKQGEDPLRKNEDRIDLFSKIGLRENEELFYTIQLRFRSQFAPGFNFPNDSVIASKFMAPGYLALNAGMDYHPADWFSIVASPAAGKFTFVLDQRLADSAAYGVMPGERIRAEFGAQVSLLLNLDAGNLGIQSRLDLFNNYTTPVKRNRGNIDVNWETLITYAVSDWFSINLTTNLIYDHDIKLPVFEERNGKEVKVDEKPQLQFKEVLGLGVSYHIGNTKEKVQADLELD